mmetsp:Transcript_156814/g.300777  ORF Transcript_156814/g.300777 Transcript_156814/m.300777 type:complete len:81 (+) Transcript_156814:757-999(+)
MVDCFLGVGSAVCFAGAAASSVTPCAWCALLSDPALAYILCLDAVQGKSMLDVFFGKSVLHVPLQLSDLLGVHGRTAMEW